MKQPGFSLATKRPWCSLTWQIIFVTILPLTILVLVIAFGSQAIHQNAMRTLVGVRDQRSVLTIAAALDEQMNHRSIDIRSLALLADGENEQKIASILSSANYLLQDFDIGLAFFNSHGALVQSSGNPSVWNAMANPILAIIQAQLTQNTVSPYLTDEFEEPASGEPMVLALAISPDRNWVAVGAFSTVKMVQATLTNAFSDSTQTSIMILNKAKRVLYRTGDFSDANNVIDHPGITEALHGESGTQYVMVGYNEHVVAYSPVEPLGWAMLLEEPWETVVTPTLRTSQTAPFVMVPILILALIALWFSARRIVRPLQTLEARAATLAWGDFKTIEEPVGGIEEIRHLQEELIRMAHKVEAAQQSLHGYIGAITAAQEDERRRLARELHDDTIQAMIALKQRVQLAQLAQEDHQESSSLEEIASLTEQTIENLRRLTRDLRPMYLEDLGLLTALEMLAQDTTAASHITVEFKRLGTEKRLDPAVELALYRMAQEALSNVTRHSQATFATLKIAFAPRLVSMEIMDDGRGFEVPQNRAEYAMNGHYGLLGLHERAELIGAVLEIHSAPGKGTHLLISLPLTQS